MAKKETNIPAVIDNAEALEAKMAAMKEAQKLFAAYTQNRWTKSSRLPRPRRTKPVFLLRRWLWKRQAWALWRTR